MGQVRSLVLGRVLLRVPALGLMPVMAAVAGAALALAAFSPGFGLAAALLILVAFAYAEIVPMVPGVAGTALPTRTGTVFGTLFSGSVTDAMVLPWVGGHLAEAFGVRVVLLDGAAAMVMVALPALAARRRQGPRTIRGRRSPGRRTHRRRRRLPARG